MLESTAAGTDAVAEPSRDRPRKAVAENRTGGLVLTRHLDESIVIAGEVEVQVVGIKSDGVRLKITAPRSIPVHRREVYEAIRDDPRPPAPGPRPASPREGQGGLVLTRHPGQRVMIGDDVEVEVAEVRARAVRLRVVAPRDVTVHRREIHDAIRRGEGPAEG